MGILIEWFAPTSSEAWKRERGNVASTWEYNKSTGKVREKNNNPETLDSKFDFTFFDFLYVRKEGLKPILKIAIVASAIALTIILMLISLSATGCIASSFVLSEFKILFYFTAVITTITSIASSIIYARFKSVEKEVHCEYYRAALFAHSCHML